MPIPDNEDILNYIDALAERGFSGEITLYFKNGNIENSRESEYLSKTELRSRANNSKQKKQYKKKRLDPS
jgi:hypothetical protein